MVVGATHVPRVHEPDVVVCCAFPLLVYSSYIILWHTKVVQYNCNHAGAAGSVLSTLELRLVSRSRSC